jgi:hypothetical protein
MENGQRIFKFELDSESKKMVMTSICHEFEKTEEEVLNSWKQDPEQMKRDWHYTMTNMA